MRNTIIHVQEANTHYKRWIESLKRTTTSEKKDNADMEDAGNNFGGKSKRKKGSITWLLGLFECVIELIIKLITKLNNIQSETITHYNRSVCTLKSDNRREISSVKEKA